MFGAVMARSGRLRSRHRNGTPQKRTPKAIESLVNSRGMTRSPKQLDIRPPPFAVETNAPANRKDYAGQAEYMFKIALYQRKFDSRPPAL